MPSATMRTGTFLQGSGPAGTAALADELLHQGLDVRMKVTGQSMAPMVRSGDSVVLRPARRIRTGDIVFYRTDTGHAVLHRVVRIVRNAEGNQTFFTMGDALCTLEGPFPGHAVIGRAVSIEHLDPILPPLDLTSLTVRAEAYLKAHGLLLRLARVFMRKLATALIRRGVRTAE